jgi:hypothetical protein
MKRFVIEREMPKGGSLEGEQLRQAAVKFTRALFEVGPDIRWLETFVAADKTFCVYLARDEAILKRHAELSGFPTAKVTEIATAVDSAAWNRRHCHC